MSFRTALSTLVLLGCAATGRADVVSGPTVGEAVPPLKAFAATGERAGNETDLVAAREGKPTVYIFVQAERWSRPMARFLRELDKTLSQRGDETHIVAVWLTGDAAKSKEYVPRLPGLLKVTDTTFGVYADVNGPGEWGINSDAHLTYVITAGQKVAAARGYRSVNATVVPEVLRELEAAVKP